QSGFFAGDGGFQVNVQGDTTLVGGAITSTQAAIEQGLNALSTRTLKTSDLQNHAYASASSSGVSLSSDLAKQGKYGIAKTAIGNAITAGKESGASTGHTRSVISGAAIAITDEAAQIDRTGMDITQTLASLNQDGASAHTAASRQDAGAMQREAQAAFEIKQTTFTELTKQTDEIYKKKLDASTRRGAPTSPKFMQVTCNANTKECLNDPKTIGGKYVSEERAIQEGQFVAINGIMNDPMRAAQLAYQNAPTDEHTGEKPKTLILMYEPKMSTTFGEILLAGYERFLSPLLGRTHIDVLHADFIQARGDQDTVSMGHSRGTLVQKNAFDILSERGFENERLSVQGVGGALNSGAYIQSAAKV
ncbi:MAG TPA: hypothetical protein PLQ67_10595, partial [Burkholderiaceae bacterium]|nr:hypothetical protein [Burkholderiaceae bacterium]